MTQQKWLKPLIIIGAILLIVFATISWMNSTYNQAVNLQENVNSQWGNVQSSYQRRADLVPNLVATVKGAAENEKAILTQVTQARAGIVNAKTPEDMELMGKKINTAINLAFEAYPEIRSTQNFSDLQAQLEGTENRINVERNRFNEAAKNYNVFVRGKFKKFALNIFGDEGEFPKKEMFLSAEGSENTPTVEF